MIDNRLLDAERRVTQKLFSGALAHLAQFLDTGCHRSVYLARMVLDQLMQSSTDANLRREAGLLIDVLENKADAYSTHAAHRATPPRAVSCLSERRAAA